MQPSTMSIDQPDQPTHDEPISGGSLSVFQVTAGITSAGCLVLMLGDMAAAEPFVPVQLRILLLAAVVGTLAIYLTMWADARNARRHDELTREVRARLGRACCAEAYVDGLARRPFGGGQGHPLN